MSYAIELTMYYRLRARRINHPTRGELARAQAAWRESSRHDMVDSVPLLFRGRFISLCCGNVRVLRPNRDVTYPRVVIRNLHAF